MITATLNQKF